MAGFARLRADLTQITDIRELPADVIFAPFLEVISSQATTGPITFVALSSINKFLDYRVISPESQNFQLVISQLVFSITHCRFEATDQSEDDTVLLKILNIMELLVCGFGNDYLSDESLCDIIETCLSMACQIKRGDLLRRSAEMTMIKLTESIFARLAELDSEDDLDLLSADNLQDHLANPPPQVIKPTEESPETETVATNTNNNPQDIPVEITSVNDTIHTSEDPVDLDTLEIPTAAAPVASTNGQKTFQKYGIASIREYLRVLISIIDSANSHQYTDSTRIMVLHLINVAFEVAGSQMARFPSLLDLTTTTLLKHLLQFTRSENPHLLQKSLRVSSTIFHTSRQNLKLQQEMFLTYMLTCLSPIAEIPKEEGVDDIFYNGVPSIPRTVINASPHPSKVSTPVGGKSATAASSASDGTLLPSFINMRSPDAREMMVEALTGLTRIPNYFVDLFVNYDCDVDRADLCEDLIGFLCRNAYPDSATWSTSSVPPLCLDALLAFLSSLAYRLDNNDYSENDKKVSSSSLQNKQRKRIVIEVTDLFNTKPKKGVPAMVERGLIEDDKPATVLKFLQGSGRINKKVLGEFLAAPQNPEYLDLFIKSFNFENKSLDEAMRDLCTEIRLPGESQQIERIMEKFAERYCEFKSNTEFVADKDAAFILSYAVIMLNTDLHNPQVKSHMTNEEFSRNLRKMNAGEDFSPEYLASVYSAIKDKEIVMPEEHDDDESFDHMWRELLIKAPQAGTAIHLASGVFDKEIFEASWQPIVSTLSYIFATATEDTVFSRVIKGFDDIAQISNRYQIAGVTDQIIYSLGKISTLTYGNLSVPLSTIEMTTDANEKIVVSELSVQFGEDFKAQLASIILFRIAKSNSSFISESWSQILVLITNLYLHSLFSALSQNLQYGIPPLPFVKPVHVLQKGKSSKDAGLFSTLSSYLTGYNDSVPEPTDEEVESTLSTVDSIRSFELPEFLDKALNTSWKHIVNSGLGVIPSLETLSPPNRQKFYPSILFLLDIVTLAAIHSKDYVIQKQVFEVFKQYISEWEVSDNSFLTRCIIYYFVLLRNSSIVMEDDLFEALTIVSEIKEVVLRKCVGQLVNPLISLADEGSWTSPLVLKKSTAYWQLFKLAASSRDCTQKVFSFVEKLAVASKPGHEGSICEDNVSGILEVFGEIVSVGACGAQLEQNKAAIAYEFKKQFDQQTAIKKAKEVIANMEVDVRRSVHALDIIASLEPCIEKLADKAEEEESGKQSAWTKVWLPYVRTLSQQCINPSRKIRHQAFAYFQKTCLSPFLQTRADFDWIILFDEELFPLFDALLNAEVYETDPKGMSHTRLQAAALLCKVFLQYVAGNFESQRAALAGEGVAMEELRRARNAELFKYWMRVLDTIDRLMNSAGKQSQLQAANRSHRDTPPHGHRTSNSNTNNTANETLEALNESVVESVKNLLLVIKASELPQDEEFWEETWKRVEAIWPGLRADLRARTGVSKEQKSEEEKADEEPQIEASEKSSEQVL